MQLVVQDEGNAAEVSQGGYKIGRWNERHALKYVWCAGPPNIRTHAKFNGKHAEQNGGSCNGRTVRRRSLILNSLDDSDVNINDSKTSANVSAVDWLFQRRRTDGSSWENFVERGGVQSRIGC